MIKILAAMVLMAAVRVIVAVIVLFFWLLYIVGTALVRAARRGHAWIRRMATGL